MQANNAKAVLLLLCGILFLSFLASAQDSEPSAPNTLTRGDSTRFNNSQYADKSTVAVAGNITEVTLFGISPTEAWQGFYGNVTGVITLEDRHGNVMYNWSAAEPQGRVYATNDSNINWSGIKCFNYSGNTSRGEINITTVETMFGISNFDYDGVNETFGNGTLPDGTAYSVDGGSDHPSFVVGIVPIAEGSCPATTTHETDEGYAHRRTGEHFIEVMLTDKRNIVFATIIENRTTDQFDDIYGFDNVTHDFQMLVLDDGHEGDTNPTDWYFYVEIE